MTQYSDLLPAIEKEFVKLCYRWDIYLQLFDSGKPNLDLLNKSGAHVFRLFQVLVIDDSMMALCRFNDPEKSMGHENASIKNLVNLTRENLSKRANAEIDKKLSELDKHTKQILILRNKAISHTDVKHVLDVKLLPRPTYDELEKSMDAIKSILNEITNELCGYKSEYKALITSPGKGVDKLGTYIL